MKILGIHLGHDSSAALVIDGKIIADVQEERFNRVKHSSDIPIQSILYCMEEAGIEDINEFDKISSSWSHTSKKVAGLFDIPIVTGKGIKNFIIHLGRTYFGADYSKPPIYFKSLSLKDPEKFVNNEHHKMHAASAHFTRKKSDKCLIFTVDGAGENVSTAVWLAEGNEIKPLSKLDGHTAGLGWAYGIVTEGLHWVHGDGEGKTMGLAPYGDPEICKGVLDDLFPEFDGIKLVKKSNIGQGNSFMLRGSNQFHFKKSREIESLVEKYGRENLAAEVQRKLEEVLIKYIKAWCKKTGIKKVAAAGGVFLNVKLNQRIWENRGKEIEDYWVYPNPADSGLAAGAALHEYYKYHTFEGIDFKHLYLGPEYNNDEIEKVLEISKVKYKKVEDAPGIAAKMLADNKIIAWYQGRMESGPRALGNRSILMSPLRQENKDIINAQVKFREGFRPFCPSLLHEKADIYLKGDREELFMITSFDVQDNKRSKVPAVVHEDGTLRPQLVRKDLNRKYWELISEFGKLTGEYILLNTSFNVMGEPIINTPSEAIRGFYSSGLDAIFIGDFLIEK